jgi:hypothetical protein
MPHKFFIANKKTSVTAGTLGDIVTNIRKL